MKAVEVTGIEALRRRFQVAGSPAPFAKALRQEAEAIVAEARRAAPGNLARTIEVEDVSQGETIAFRIGTRDPAGRAAEFGTLTTPATPWFWPILQAHLPRIKDKLRNIALGPLSGRSPRV
jgi:hypothetical protein